MEEEIRALLLADAQIAALAGDRVNFGAHPQGADLPGVVLNLIASDDDYGIAGATGFSDASVQVDCYGKTYGAAKALSRAVSAALGGYSGGSIQGAFSEGAQDGRDAASGMADVYRVRMQFQVSYTV